jgi:hypothetical protein
MVMQFLLCQAMARPSAEPDPARPAGSGAAKSAKIFIWVTGLLLCLPVIGLMVAAAGHKIIAIIVIVLALVAMCQGAPWKGILILVGGAVVLPLCFFVGLFATSALSGETKTEAKKPAKSAASSKPVKAH